MSREKTSPYKTKLTIVVLFIPIVTGILFACLFLPEFYNVGIKKQFGAYDFQNSAVWWYRNNEVYWKCNLVAGLLLLLLSVASAIFIFKKKMPWAFAGIFLILLTLFYLLVIDTPSPDQIR